MMDWAKAVRARAKEFEGSVSWADDHNTRFQRQFGAKSIVAK